jgi:hypothetical protein
LHAAPRRDSVARVKLAVPLIAAALGLASCAPRVPPAPTLARQCLAELDRRGVEYKVAPMPAASSSCAVDDPVRVSAAGVPWNQPAIVACPFALTLDDFARDVVEPLARRYFGEPVTLLRHYGAYSCRTTHGGRDSLHAKGEAIDIAAFVLADGTVVSVEQGWRGGGREGRFLHALAHAACERFSVVLTPDSDSDHANHIHLDSGRYKLCGVHG